MIPAVYQCLRSVVVPLTAEFPFLRFAIVPPIGKYLLQMLLYLRPRKQSVNPIFCRAESLPSPNNEDYDVADLYDLNTAAGAVIDLASPPSSHQSRI